jgi:hypothetical protein
MMKKNEITGTLENWYVEQVTDEEFVINGHVYGDIHRRFEPGAFIHTSGIKNREVKEGDVVETRNSRYKLGRPMNETLRRGLRS